LHVRLKVVESRRICGITPAPAHQVKPSAPGSVKRSTGVKPEQVRCCLSWFYSTFLDTWMFCTALSAGKSANASRPPFRRSTSFRTDQKPGTTLCQPQRVARIGLDHWTPDSEGRQRVVPGKKDHAFSTRQHRSGRSLWNAQPRQSLFAYFNPNSPAAVLR